MKFEDYLHRLNEVLDSNEGQLTFSEASAAGIPKDAFYRYVKDKGLVKHGRGLYLSEDALPDELALLQACFPKVIFSHDTALFLHEMSEREPVPLSVSVDSGYNSSTLRHQGVHIHYVKPEWYGLGVRDVKTPNGNIVKAYDKERTICDLIRKKDCVDVTEFNYALKTYATSKDKNLARLSEYARTMNMESRIWDAMGVLL